MSIELEDLVGIHELTAVDDASTEIAHRWNDEMETVNCFRFRLDGIIYEAIEDPEDGYRSCMRELIMVEPDTNMFNKFPACEVMCRMRDRGQYTTSNILQMIDIHTGKVVLEVGTDNTDDYYPWYVATFDPLAMFINADAVREQDAAKVMPEVPGLKLGPECTNCDDSGCTICMPVCPLCGTTPSVQQRHENFNDGFEYGCGTVVTGPKYGQITSTLKCRVNWIANGRTD